MKSESIQRLSAIDLNLLVVFAALARTRHVTNAAKLVGITQPAMSHALQRLRDLFEDQLFVKSSQGMVLTPLAEKLANEVQSLTQHVDQLIYGAEEFSPKTLERTFRLRTTDLLESLVLPKLLPSLEQQAPTVQVAFRPVGLELPRQELETGECDLALAGFFGDLPGGFYQQQLFQDQLMCAVHRDHTTARKARTLSVQEFCEHRHILVAPGGTLDGAMDKTLAKLKLKRFVAVGVTGFSLGVWATNITDYILVAPSRFLKAHKERFELVLFDPPVPTLPIKVVQVWHERSHQDPAHRWFRELVKSSIVD